MIAIRRRHTVRCLFLCGAAAVAACATPPSYQPPQQPQLAQATSAPPRLRPPEQLPETARVLLRGRMAAHANDMGALMSAIIVAGDFSLKFRLKKSLVEQNVQANGQPRPASR